MSARRRPARPLGPDALRLVASCFRVLSEPVRLAVLQTLEAGELSIGRLAEAVGASQPNVSKHVRLLEEAGLVRRRAVGNTVLCDIADASVFELCDLVCRSLGRRLERQAGLFDRPARRGGGGEHRAAS